MILIIRQYVASLRERGELDAMLPDLLLELGYTVISRPSVGTRQYGVDIAAIGPASEGERKLYLFSVKPGDLGRADWDGSPQALRPSLDEIREIYLRLRIPKEHRNRKVVICLCVGGDVVEAVQDNVTGYVEQYTSDQLAFEQWNGDVIAGLLVKGILKENLLMSELRTSFQKSVAMVDEPAICFAHFRLLVRQLCKPHPTAKLRLSAARQVYLCLWVVFVWARDAGNVEGAYQAGEFAVLHVWKLLGGDLDKPGKGSREAAQTFQELVLVQRLIADELIAGKVLPHVEKQHALSIAVGSSSPVDVNLRLFDLAGRVALFGLWMLWDRSGDATLPDVRDDWQQTGADELAQSLVHLVRNNPALLSPMQDAQSIDIALVLIFLTMQRRWQPAVANWLDAMSDSIIFAYRTHARYPTIQNDYRELLNHPRERTDKYREEQTAASTLVPLVALWSRGIAATEAEKSVTAFARDFAAHCNCQLWLPDEDSEAQLYSGEDRHGAMLTGLPIANDLAKAFQMVSDECRATQHFDDLSAIDMGHWPIILMACRHYRLPIPPQLWIGLLEEFDRSETQAVAKQDD
jgi:hypothetical protein